MIQKIEKKLEEYYENTVNLAIRFGWITRKEWNNKFKHYRDEWGHSFIHLLECKMHGVGNFLTTNKIMIKNRKYLIKRFGVNIMTPEELIEFQK